MLRARDANYELRLWARDANYELEAEGYKFGPMVVQAEGYKRGLHIKGYATPEGP